MIRDDLLNPQQVYSELVVISEDECSNLFPCPPSMQKDDYRSG